MACMSDFESAVMGRQWWKRLLGIWPKDIDYFHGYEPAPVTHEGK